MLVEALQRRYGDEIDDVATIVLGAALVLASAGLLAKTLVLGASGDDRPYMLTPRDRYLAMSIGLVGGFVLGLTSVGTGTFFGLLLILLFPLTAAQGRRNGHLPCGRAALGRRLRASRGRQC